MVVADVGEPNWFVTPDNTTWLVVAEGIFAVKSFVESAVWLNRL